MKKFNLDYFFALEDDLRRIGRFIEIHPDNFRAYSLELARLLMTACAEIEVTCKEISKEISPENNPENISDIQAIITTRHWFNELERVEIRSKGLKFQPWKGWKSKSPKWWRAYNKVKHNRFLYYKEANLENTLLAICGYAVVISWCGKYIEHQNFRGDFFRIFLKHIDFSSGDPFALAGE